MAYRSDSSEFPKVPAPYSDPAVKLLRKHSEVAKRSITSLEAQIDQAHKDLKHANDLATKLVAELKERQVEFRAYQRLLDQIVRMTGGIGSQGYR